MTRVDGSTVRWELCGPGESLTAEVVTALSGLVQQAQASDPLQTVTVIAPDRTSALALRRQLAQQRGGLFAVRFEILPRLAELLAAGSIAAQGKRPLRPAIRAEAIRSVLRTAPGMLAAVADHPSTVSTLERTLDDLASVPAEQLRVLPGQRGQELRRLSLAVGQLLSQRYDHHELLRAAAAQVDADPHATTELGQIIAVVTEPPSAAAAELFAALGRRGMVVLQPQTGEAEMPAAPQRALDRIISAPDPDAEVEAAVRLLAERFHQGVPLHRMALLWTTRRPYAVLVRDALAAAELPASGLVRPALARSLAGTALTGLLELAGGRMERDQVMHWLAAAPIRAESDGAECDGARWDLVSRRAGIVRDAAQWLDRLERHRYSARVQAENARKDDDQARAQRHDTEADQAEALRAFIAQLSEALRPPRTSWTAMVEWADGLLDRYLGAPRQEWPDAEIEAERSVRQLLRGLIELDELHPGQGAAVPVDLTAFRRAVEAELQAPYGEDVPLLDGVFVGDIRRATCMDFAVTIVVGLGEGLAPAPVRQDPLLRDHDRQLISGLRLAKDDLAAQRRGYAWFLRSGGERIACTARSDPRGGRERMPSRWLLEQAGLHEAATVTATDLVELKDRPWLQWLASFPQSFRDFPSGPTQVRVRQAVSAAALGTLPEFALTDPRLSRGLEALHHRRSGVLGPWTGLVGAEMGLDLGTHALSPTRLEAWAACPFRYLLTRVWDVEEAIRPEEALKIDPRERGSLVHKILELFFAEVMHDLPVGAWSDAHRTRLHEIAQERFTITERQGTTGKALLWRIEQQRLRRELDAFLDAEPQLRAQHGTVPVAVEHAFGFDGPPAELEQDGRVLRFRGFVDRIDQSPSHHTVAVIDYKTGDPGPHKRALSSDPIGMGQLLQLPVYALAARARSVALGTVPEQILASYWFLTQDGIEVVSWDPAAEPRFRQAVSTITAGIHQGVFPHRPAQAALGKTTCDRCAFSLACDSDRFRRWDTVKLLPQLDGLRALETVTEETAPA